MMTFWKAEALIGYLPVVWWWHSAYIRQQRLYQE
jgi:hypothetical protein